MKCSLNLILEERSVNELFGGRIGAVKATSKDADKLVTSLNKYFNKNNKHIEFKNNSKAKDFEILGKFYFDGTSYDVIINEDSDNPEKKICIEVFDSLKRRNIVGSKQGLILNDQKICTELERILKRKNINIEKCLTPSAYKSNYNFDNKEIDYNDYDNASNRKQKQTKDKKQKSSYRTDDTPKISYNRDVFNDYSYSRIDRDPYSTAWV